MSTAMQAWSGWIECDLDGHPDPWRIAAGLRAPGRPMVVLDGGGFAHGWRTRVALRATPRPSLDLAGLDRRLAERRAVGGPAACGVAVLAAYDASAPLLVVEVDAALEWDVDGRARAVARDAAAPEIEGLEDLPSQPPQRQDETTAAAPPPRTSLPRERYVEAVRAVQRHIRAGDIYQANLTQRFECAGAAPGFRVWRRLAAATPAPRSAYLELPGLTLASVSPETFLRADRAGRVETFPIKGTRRRGATPGDDRRLARELESSEKDRAELTMIVDLERNDLSRVCVPGSVLTPAVARLRTFAAVHHLEGHVVGQLRPDVKPSDLIGATFPGGSITGAPKRRAVEILGAIEPVRRGYYTGSLFWFGDDGSMDSSILIRTVVTSDGRTYVGSGGGVVADSDPEGEWRESNDKARALLAVLGTSPEEAVP